MSKVLKINKTLKDIRLKNNLTQEEMAKILGYRDKSGYNHLENGSVKLSIDKAKILADKFDLDLEIFFI